MTYMPLSEDVVSGDRLPSVKAIRYALNTPVSLELTIRSPLIAEKAFAPEAPILKSVVW